MYKNANFINGGIAHLTVLTIIFFLVSGANTGAQFLSNFAIGAGISTTKIMGDNPGAWQILNKDTSIYQLGGSFDGPQPGIDIRMTFDMDKRGSIRVPLGFEYTFYSAKERVPIARYLTAFLSNELNVSSIYTGIQYAFVEFPKARAKGYIGFDVRASFIHKATYRYQERYVLNPENDQDITLHIKEDTWRMGTIFRLGFEGDLYKKMQINVSAGPGMMNLVGRDDERRELLTPKKLFETQESVVWNFYFTLMLQYRI